MDESTNLFTVKAAWYYYIVGYTQSDIAEMLGLSRAKVVRLLDEAREQGVVQFTFRANDSARMGIEQELIHRFGLEDAFVVPTARDRAATEDSIARATSMYISSHLEDGSYLNMGYGATYRNTLPSGLPPVVDWDGREVEVDQAWLCPVTLLVLFQYPKKINLYIPENA